MADTWKDSKYSKRGHAKNSGPKKSMTYSRKPKYGKKEYTE